MRKIAKEADYLEEHLSKGPVQTEVNCVFLQHIEKPAAGLVPSGTLKKCCW